MLLERVEERQTASDAAPPAIPEKVKGLIGVRRIRRCLVTARDILRFAQAIGEPSPTSSGNGEPLVAPPLFCQTLTFEEVPVEQLPPDGSPAELDVPIPARRVVGGSSEYTIHRRVREGDLITVESRLKDVIAKQGKSGPLYLVVVETRCTDAGGLPVATEVATYIKKP